MKVPNFASNEKFATEFISNLESEFRMLEGDRQEREAKWQSYYDAWSTTDQDPEGLRMYRGRANIQMPQIRKEVETMSRRLAKAMFPEDYLKAEPSPSGSPKEAVTNTQIVRHYLDNVMAVQSKIVPWLKQCVVYGTSPAKIFWKKEEQEVVFRKRKYTTDKDTGEIVPGFEIVKEKIPIYNAPVIKTCDMMDTYVSPSTASDPSEIKKIFYRQKVTYDDLKQLEDAGVAVNVKDLKGKGKKIDRPFEQAQERMQSFGESGETYATDESGEYFDLMEVWGKAELPGLGYVPFVCLYVNGSIPIRIQRNPLWHQSPPFIFARFIQGLGNEFYGRGLPEASVAIQAQLNDTLNQTMDSVNLSLNTITIVNPAYAPNQESFEVENGAIWWADPAGVKQFEFPDLSEKGMRNAGALRAMITELSDNAPQLPDPIAGKARSTGQAQMAINEWMTDLYSFVNLIIIEAMNPMAKQVHSLLQQNVEDDEIIRICGKYSGEWINKIVTPVDIVGNYNFKWIGAIQVESTSIKNQQLLNLLKIIPSIPQDGSFKIKWDNILIKIFRDGFNIKDIDTVIETSDINASVPPMIENRLVEKGGHISVVDADDDDVHNRVHQNLLAHKDPMVRYSIAKHIEEHNRSKKAKADKILQAQAMMAMAQAQQNPQPPGMVGRPPNDMAQKIRNPLGNQGQLSEATEPDDLERGIR